MTDFNFATELSSRQSQLRLQMKLALEHLESRNYLILQSLWVHRYGFKTLPEFEEQETNASDASQADIHHPFPLDPVAKITNITHKDESKKLISTSMDFSSKGDDQLFEIENDSTDESLEMSKLVSCAPEKVDDSLQDAGSRQLNDLVVSKSAISSSVAPPPPPRTMSHLRRWMPTPADEQCPHSS